MKSNYTLGSQVGSVNRLHGSYQTSEIMFGRVLNVILDNEVEVYDDEGKEVRLPIGSIQYRPVSADKTVNTTKFYAQPLHSNVKQIPLVNEIVVIQLAPTSDIQFNTNIQFPYYSSVVNLWGSPHHSALPEPGTNVEKVLGEVKEQSNINPLFPFPGDLLVEGRQGQSIRIGGNKSPKNPWVDDSNDGKPFIIISNGQIETDNGVDPIIEDVNKDPGSIYIVSDHIVPLNPANSKRESYDTPPVIPKSFIGSQVVVTGGRIYLNARDESVLISAKDSVGLNADTLNFDGKEMICVDADVVLLGKAARTANPDSREPVMKGQQFQNWMNTLLDSLQNVGNAMTRASTSDGGTVPSLIVEGQCLQESITQLRSEIRSIMSNKVFVE
ncbi:MAG TPA: hypothetical protein PKC87_00640 [Candidatus Absconditabacterales bacterium]|nr:hypothetical protein [Candidatus Absconditabacterales bacterium]